LEQKKTYRSKAFIWTAIIHGLLILFLVLYKIITPIPPFAEGGGGTGLGLEVNLGTIDEGMSGEIQQPQPVVENTPIPEQSQQPEKLMTDESDDESEPLKTADVNPKVITPVKVKTIIQTKPKETPKPVQEQKPVETKPTVNSKALFPAKPQSNNTGTGSKPGVSGSPDGTAGSNLYAGNGTGSGGGTGGGSGTGNGTGVGGGISFSLEGRNPSALPKPEYNGTEEGKVVVEVTVDKTGNVVNAVPGVKGSTTLDDYLLSVAKKAALQSKFDRKPDAPAFQKGTITYRFVLQ
jgi:outer membrane biosynthesis protein TonB